MFICLVLECHPPLPHLNVLVQHLNEHRNFYQFLKDARKGFVSLVQTEQQ